MLVILINNLISIFSTGSSTVSSDGSCAILFLMLCGVASISVTAVCRFHRIPACLPASCVIPMSRQGVLLRIGTRQHWMRMRRQSTYDDSSSSSSCNVWAEEAAVHGTM